MIKSGSDQDSSKCENKQMLKESKWITNIKDV